MSVGLKELGGLFNRFLVYLIIIKVSVYLICMDKSFNSKVSKMGRKQIINVPKKHHKDFPIGKKVKVVD